MQPAPEPVPEPPTPPRSPSAKYGDASLRAGPTVVGKVTDAYDDVSIPSGMSQTGFPADTSKLEQCLESADQSDEPGFDSNAPAWTTALGGKLDDLCERALTLEQELRAHCWEVPMKQAEPPTVNEDCQHSMMCSVSAVDVMADLQRCRESALLPKALDGAVERELNSLRTSVAGMQANFGELTDMVKQIGGELRNLHDLNRREANPSPPVVMVFPNPAPCMTRVMEQQAFTIQLPAHMPAHVPAAVDATPRVMSTRSVNVAGSSSMPQSLVATSALSPPQTMSASCLTSVRMATASPFSPRVVRASVTSPVQGFGSVASASCIPNERLAQNPAVHHVHGKLVTRRNSL